jgi:hypothetical protein
LPASAHDSGSRWFALPFLCGSFIRYSLPALTGAFKASPKFRLSHDAALFLLVFYLSFFTCPPSCLRHNILRRMPRINLRRINWSPRRAVWMWRGRNESMSAGVGKPGGKDNRARRQRVREMCRCGPAVSRTVEELANMKTDVVHKMRAAKRAIVLRISGWQLADKWTRILSMKTDVVHKMRAAKCAIALGISGWQLADKWTRILSWMKAHPMNVVAIVTLFVAAWGAFESSRANHPVARVKITYAEMVAPEGPKSGAFGGSFFLANEGARPCTVQYVLVKVGDLLLTTGGTPSDKWYRPAGSGYYECTPLPHTVPGYATEKIFFSGEHRAVHPWGRDTKHPNEVTIEVNVDYRKRSLRIDLSRCEDDPSDTSRYAYR